MSLSEGLLGLRSSEMPVVHSAANFLYLSYVASVIFSDAIWCITTGKSVLKFLEFLWIYMWSHGPQI